MTTSNIITGTSVADTLSGLGGDYTLVGGGGNDIYIVDSAGDVIVELAPAMPIRLVSSALIGGSAVGSTQESAISGSGRYVGFIGPGRSIGLTPFPSTSAKDLLLLDLDGNGIQRISATADGTPGSVGGFRIEISYDGRYVAFYNLSPNLVPRGTPGGSILVKDMLSGQITIASSTSDGALGDGDNPSFTADGRWVVFESTSSEFSARGRGLSDIYLKDFDTNELYPLSLAFDGGLANGDSAKPTISDNGRYVAFSSLASNLVPNDTNGLKDDFMIDVTTGDVTRIFIATDASDNLKSRNGTLSGDGRFYVFESRSSTLVPNDTNGVSDLFIKDLSTGRISRVSVAADGTQGNRASTPTDLDGFAVSADGRFVAFISDASNLVPGDTNNASDVFVKNTDTGEIVRVSVSASGLQANSRSLSVDISADGGIITFGTLAGNLTTGDGNSVQDVYAVGNPLLNGGVDSVVTSISYTLPSNIEELILQGTRLSGVGNALDNTMGVLASDGKSLAVGTGNQLDGAGGRDTVVLPESRSFYRVAKDGSDFIVSASASPADALKLLRIEAIDFHGQLYDLKAPALASTPVYGKSQTFLFDPVYYLLAFPQLVPTFTIATAFQDYFSSGGAAAGRTPNSWFSAAYYRNRWDDLRSAGLDDATLFSHYNLYGVWEGRSGGPKLDRFDGAKYLQQNPDVAAYVDGHLPDFLGSRSNGAIAHYMIYGSNEDRLGFDLSGQQIDLGYIL